MVKRNKLLQFGVVFALFASVLISSCSSDDNKGMTFPLSADISNSVDDRQVAFQGLTHSATSWLWDFGDGQTSTEQNPVHVYESGGYYIATLTATDKSGEVVTDEVQLAIALTPYVLLTGGPTNINGKTWKLSASHSANGDYLAWANADLTPFEGAPAPLPDGAFGLILGMGEVYEDTFTFHFDGTYESDNKVGTAFSGVFYQVATTGGAGIVNWGGIDFGLVTGIYAPEDNMTFTYVASEDFINPSIFGGVSYPDSMTLDFSAPAAYVGFLDFQRKVIVQEITDSSMKVVMFASLDEGAATAGGLSTNALVLTFEVVN
jgi:hypothetical protein